ncbi:peptidoglycan/LPS O-acetylase OafA/YrhL [Dyadobacter jejuensis]|uniref:Peptidoglycan/LPS O-acetylase OafA/YrhL n=1 Tax=Dyadobacter jejuensis TaxID=1082580 RepID=A0A316AP18_9BACT|nr:acyltransferase [Dyadobacter jejuensis]PWJ59302.1 peptidoglycan/LPS O-acetylase OafA/YrhL [Dyadobacter jejuensis]
MKGRVEQLDGLRGIFSVLVVAHHHNAFKESIFYNNFFVINSDLFVDFFFVLSGFVIAMNYNDRIKSPSDFFSFLKKRIIRLYPLLVFTELVFLLFNIIGDHSPLKNFSMDPMYYVRTVTDTLTFMGSTPIFGDWIGLNYPSWSISAEMIAYVVYGLVILLALRNRYVVLTLISMACIGFIVWKGDYILAYDYGFIRGILCFCVGVFTHLLLSKVRLRLSTAEFPFIILMVAAMYATHHWELHLGKLMFPFIFSMGIIVFSSSTGPLTRLLSSGPMQYLGKISYSIYLNHAIVLILMNVVLFRFFKLSPTEPMIFASLVGSIALTIAYSHLTYHLVEMRIGNYFRKKTTTSRTISSH